jgi:radical SAM enzyme (TIGR01210 family)
MNKLPKFAPVKFPRGTKAPEPSRPRETYPEFEKRTKLLLQLAADAPELVKIHRVHKAREIINRRLSQILFGHEEITIFTSDFRLIPQLGRKGIYAFILLPGGCHWALEHGGRCEFCEFQPLVEAAVQNLPFSHEEFVAIFTAGFATFLEADIINVFTAGSYLNPGEIPLESQLAMAEAVAKAKRPSILRIESRVQWILEETVAPLVKALANGTDPDGNPKTLDIAIGVETQDDELRNKILRKGMSRKGLEQAIKLAKGLGARVSAYIMLMPVNLPERYAVEECIESIRFAFDKGVDEVLLQAKYSVNPAIKCPKLWSIVKVLRNTAYRGPVMLGKWEGELPQPEVWPKNCDICTPAVMNVLEAWREKLNLDTLDEENLPDCECKQAWEAELNKPLINV